MRAGRGNSRIEDWEMLRKEVEQTDYGEAVTIRSGWRTL